MLGLGVLGLAGLGGLGALGYVLSRTKLESGASVFKNDAPPQALWEQWQKRGWVREAAHYLPLGRNVQCKVCPNRCLLEPGDRSHCRTKINKDGKLYTLAYGNPCALHVDPIEKKPLYHFLPQSGAFSLATAGCVLRCLNCQNWEISQSKPEETKDSSGAEVRCPVEDIFDLNAEDDRKLSLFPEDVVAAAAHFRCASIAYTYSEPTAYFEYMYDTSKLARAKGLKNVWISCGQMGAEALGDLCQYLDAANINLKSFSEETYVTLNEGKLHAVLDTLKLLKQRGVWFEVTNLIVPTYTDKPEMIRRMCGWLIENIGPDYPLHFSRFSPKYKLQHLPPTPLDILLEAREIALKAGLHYVYLGNVDRRREKTEGAEDTFCPSCKKALIRRYGFAVLSNDVQAGKCKHCQAKIAGVWA